MTVSVEQDCTIAAWREQQPGGSFAIIFITTFNDMLIKGQVIQELLENGWYLLDVATVTVNCHDFGRHVSRRGAFCASSWFGQS